MANVPLQIIMLPLILLGTMASLYLAYYIGKHKIKSQNHFFIYFWGVLLLFEVIYLLYIRSHGPVQFLPPSFITNYTYGTIVFIIYFVQCLSANVSISTKFRLIGASAMLNYIIAPLCLVFLS